MSFAVCCALVLTGGVGLSAALLGADLPWHAPYLPDAVRDWRASSPARTYNRSDIFDYMDGAGELYLAYDFQEVAVRDYQGPGGVKIAAEIYRMRSSADAYGVYSHERGPDEPDGPAVGIGQDRDYALGLLRFWKGKIFARILADKETERSRAAVLALGRQISENIPCVGERPDLLRALPEDGLIPESVCCFHKHTVLNYHYYLSDGNLLNMGEKTDAVIADYRAQGGRPRLLIVRYPTSGDASAAYKRFAEAYFGPGTASPHIEKVEGGVYAGAALEDRVIRLVFEAPNADMCRKLLEIVLRKDLRNSQ